MSALRLRRLRLSPRWALRVVIAALCVSPRAALADGMSVMDGMDMPDSRPHATPTSAPSRQASRPSSSVPAMPAQPTQGASTGQPAGHANPMPGMAMHDMGSMSADSMSSVTEINAPMSREGSGTSWVPDATPVYGHMFSHGNDMEMTHGMLELRYVDTGSARGDQRIVAPGWWMYMRTHPLSPNQQLGFRVMLTPDAATVGGSGYPELFQTGESWHERPLHDAQHPHDVVSELSTSFSQRLNKHLDASLYVGYPGEPALGPPAYMHRSLAYDYATTPIGHHWEDATHISFGVVTAGIASSKIKLETSSFTGREPNEVRTNFDPVHLDSQSARVSWNPNRFLAVQVSNGFITSPESLDPLSSIHRTSGSIVYERPLRAGRTLSQALVFGQNADSMGPRTNALLYEIDYRAAHNAYFSRIERVQKTAGDVVFAAVPATTLFPLTAFTIGVVHDVAHGTGRSVPGVGADVTYGLKPASLSTLYGGGNPFSFEVYWRVRPAEIAPYASAAQK